MTALQSTWDLSIAKAVPFPRELNTNIQASIGSILSLLEGVVSDSVSIHLRDLRVVPKLNLSC